jgi:hypothetical protein
MNRILPRTRRIPERRAGRVVMDVEKELGAVMLIPFWK